MQKSRSPILVLGLILTLVAVVAIAYVLRPSAAPSGELEAVPIEVSTQVPAETSSDLLEETVDPDPPATNEVDVADEEPKLGGIYEVQQSGSTVRFLLDEVLRGNDFTVVGKTNQIAGQILIDVDDPTASQLGLVQVNARTIVTDNENRNRAIRNEILDVDAYEFISFEATVLENLPDSIVVGETYAFSIVGMLTIRDVSQEVRFDASLSIDAADQISGSASTTVLYADYNLIIPSVPFVASVEDEVLLEIEFTATAQ